MPPVIHDVPWHYVSLAILVGAALLSHGVTVVGRSWEKELKLPEWFSVAAQGFGILMSAACGSLAGYLVWNWGLGGMVGLVGGFASSLVLSLVRARLAAAKDAVTDEVKK